MEISLITVIYGYVIMVIAYEKDLLQPNNNKHKYIQLISTIYVSKEIFFKICLKK